MAIAKILLLALLCLTLSDPAKAAESKPAWQAEWEKTL